MVTYSHSEGNTSADELGDSAYSVASEQLGHSTNYTRLIAHSGMLYQKQILLPICQHRTLPLIHQLSL